MFWTVQVVLECGRVIKLFFACFTIVVWHSLRWHIYKKKKGLFFLREKEQSDIERYHVMVQRDAQPFSFFLLKKKWVRWTRMIKYKPWILLKKMKKQNKSVLSKKPWMVKLSIFFFFFFMNVSTCKIDVKRNFSLLERSVETIEARFTTRVLRTLPSIRRRLTSEILAQVIVDYYGPSRWMCTLDDNHNLLFFAIDDEQIKNELLIYLNEVKRKMFISRMSNRKKKKKIQHVL